MATITKPAFSNFLERLFAEADAATSPAMKQMPAAERERLLRSKTEYLDFYGAIKDLWLPVSRQTGELLYLLARCSRAQTIVEFGTSFGISTLYLAAALRDNGGGTLITTEFEPAKVARAKENLEAIGLADLVEVRSGDALETLKADLPESIDLVVLDGAKSLYPEVLALLEGRIRSGGLVLADDADYSPDYLEYVRSAAGRFVSIPFADDIELSVLAA